MRISELLRKDFINLAMVARTKDEAIHQMAQLAKGHPHMGDFPTFCRAIYERESSGSTAIGNGIAIPHARTDQVKDMLLVAGRLTEGVKFEDGEITPVRLIFLVGTPKRMVTDYLRLVGTLARCLNNKDFRERLLVVKTPEELIQEFAQCEGRLMV